MASTAVSRPLHNFCLPPWSELPAMANNSTAIPTAPNRNYKPFVEKRSTRSSNSKHKPKILVLKLKYRDKTLCNVSTTSDESPTSKTQPQQPKKMNTVVPVLEKKEVPKKKKKRSYITLLGRKEIEQDILKIAESLGHGRRARRSKKKQAKELKTTLALLFPGSQYLKTMY